MRWFRRSPQAPQTPRPSSEGGGKSRDPEGRDDRLSAYLDGDLTTAESAGVEWESEGDAATREALEGMRAVRSSLAALGLEAAPRSFALPATMATQPRRMPRLELGMRMATVAAALVTVAVFVSPSMSGSDEASDATLTAFSSAPQQRNAAAEAPADTAAEALQSAPAPEAAPALVPPAPGAPSGGAAAEDRLYPSEAQGGQSEQNGAGATGAGTGRSNAMGGGGSSAGGDGGGGGGATSGGGSRGDLWSAPRLGALGLTLVLGASAIGLWWRRRPGV